jgi:hypothetical protein
MVKSALRILILLVLTLPFMGPRRADALGWDVLTTYYTGSCPNGLTYNGYKWRECDATNSQDGTLNGTWRCDDIYDCTYGTFHYNWYEKCSGVWAFRYTSFDTNTWPESEDCNCT